MNPRIVAGVCGSHQVWRRTEGPIAYVLTECIYDDAGAIELSFRCDDKTCRYGGRVVELDDCPDLGPDRCAPDAGAASDASADTPVRGAIEPCLTGGAPPPAGTDLGCTPNPQTCRPTYAEQLAVTTGFESCHEAGHIVEVVTGTCGAHQVWQRSDGFTQIECAYDQTGAVEFSSFCTDAGCAFSGRVVRIDATCLFGPDRCAADDAGTDAADAG